MTTIGDVIEIDLPGPEWLEIEVPDAIVVVKSDDYAACHGEIEWATFTITVALIDDQQLASSDSLGPLMQRRFPQGPPTESAAVAVGSPARLFEYYDGVRQIHSYFVRRSPSAVVELRFATFLHPTGAPKVDLGAAAQETFNGMRWLQCSP